MMRLKKKNLRNIRRIFEEKTGTQLTAVGLFPVRKVLLVAVVIACAAAMAAFTYPLFTPLNGDELTLKADYKGGGIVSVYVQNDSDKTLEFEQQVKLYNWGTGEEIIPLDAEATFENTRFEPHSSGIMTVDLSRAYDIEALENVKPSESGTGSYYLLLTNNSFLFGHDWMCSFRFAQVEEKMEETTQETAPWPAQNLDRIEEELWFYFEDAYYDEIPAFNQANFDYLQKVQELLLRTEGTLVRPVDPWITIERDADEEAVQVGLNYHAIDGYYRVVGSMFSGGDSDHALTLKALLPQEKGETDGGQYLPLIYLFVYEKSALEVEAPYAFIYGQILTFDEITKYLVYEDERYEIYEVTDLFYTDLDDYMDYFISTNDSVCVDEQVRRQVHSIYDYFKDKQNLKNAIVNRQAEAEANGYAG